MEEKQLTLETCQAAAVVVSENLAGKSYPESSYQWFTAERGENFEQDSTKVRPRLEVIWYFH